MSEKKVEKVARRPPRSRFWAFEVYCENGGLKRFEDFITSSVVPAVGVRVCYVLHDLDTDENGEVKKPHVHVLADFGYSVAENRVLEFFGDIPANGHVERCNNAHAYEQYMCHVGYPDKFQYPLDNRVCINGYQLHKDGGTSPLVELLELWYSHDFKSFPDFVRFTMDEYPDLTSTLVGCAFNFKLSVGLK